MIREQELALKADTVKSLTICGAADESVRSGKAVRL